jgi:hypothetical protein
MTEYYTVTELAFGSRDNQKEKVCILADVRRKPREGDRSIQVWSHSAQKLVSLPKSQVEIQYPGDRWFAISVPRWLLTRERLWAATPAADDDASDRRYAEDIVSMQNKNVLLPGQRMSLGGGSADGGRARRS